MKYCKFNSIGYSIFKFAAKIKEIDDKRKTMSSKWSTPQHLQNTHIKSQRRVISC